MEAIFSQVCSDPNVQFTSDDVEKWMEKIDGSLYNYLEGKTTSIIEQEKEEALLSILDNDVRDRMKESLVMYRLVSDLQDARLGRYCRWITEKEGKQTLHSGGYLVKIIFSDKGVSLLCERAKKYKMQLKMDETSVFQKMTAEEWVVVMANNYSEKEK